MGINFGIRGGDIADTSQINSYIENLEQSANANFFLNTHHFDYESANSNFDFIAYYSKNYLFVASVYVILASDSDPTIYPSKPAIWDITDDASVTVTKIIDNKQSFNFTKNNEDYKIVIMRTKYELNKSDVYIRIKFNAINGVKDILSGSYSINQFLCWQENSTQITYNRITEGITAISDDFNFGSLKKQSFASCLIDDNDKMVIYSDGVGYFENAPISEFFMLNNFTYDYLKSMRFIFKTPVNSNNSFYLYINARGDGMFEISLQIENTFTGYCEYSISNIEQFILSISQLKEQSLNTEKRKCIIERFNAGVVDFCFCIRVENEVFKLPDISSEDSFNAATLFCTKQNAMSSHNASIFRGELGLDLIQNGFNNYSDLVSLSYLRSFFIIFKNNFFQTGIEFPFNYILGNGYSIKMGFTKELST